MDRRQTTLNHEGLQSVVIENLNIERIAFIESETDSPLRVNANAPLPFPIALQSLQHVRRGQAQILDASRGVQLCKAHRRTHSNLRRKTARLARRVESLRFGVGEGVDHFK